MYIIDVLKLIEIFCCIDDFCIEFSTTLENSSLKRDLKNKKVPEPGLTISEMMTIELFYHFSGCKCFKYYYKNLVEGQLISYFPKLLSYNRFVQLKPRMNLYLFAFINLARIGNKTGIYFIDSAKLPVCHNLRIYSNRVFKGIAKRGKTSTGWFHGLKIHIIINHHGELKGFWLTPGNVSDRNGKVVMKTCKGLYGKIFGDKGYISSEMTKNLFNQGLSLITKIQKNMKNKLMKIEDKILLMKRGLVETVIDLLKAICDIDHTRHRSPANAIVNIWAGLAAYTFFDKKPSIMRALNYSYNNKLVKF
jgi:hypothetical protein